MCSGATHPPMPRKICQTENVIFGQSDYLYGVTSVVLRHATMLA